MTIPQTLQIAIQYHRAGQLAEAESLYRQILAAQPNHPDALHLFGLIAHQTGRHDLAVEWIRQSIRFSPNNPAAHSNLSEACRSLGRFDEAVLACRAALQIKPDFPEAHNHLGNALRDGGQLVEAMAAYRRAIQLKPDFLEAHNHLGIALRKAGRLDEAVAAYRHALELAPDHPEAHVNLANALKEQGRLDEALVLYRRALELKPGFPEGHINLGIALKEQGRRPEAMAAFRRALELKLDDPEAQVNLGITLAEQDQLDEAVAAYRRALELKPDFAEACSNLGAALAGQGQPDEAIAMFRRALQLKPDYLQALNNLGLALRDQGQLDEAIALCRRALELRSDDPEAHNHLGIALARQAQFGEAIAAYRRALQLKPDFPEAHNNLGAALAEQGQIDAAIGSYRRALQLKPDDLEGLNNLGTALSERGDLDESIASYRRALELKPNSPETLNNLGGALKDQGKLDESIASYRRALDINPEFVGAHSNLIFTLHFHPDHDYRMISEEHQRWNRQFSDPLKKFVLPHSNDRDRDRRLRLGYVSPDFRDHPVGRHALPLFERHDREQFEILCYSAVTRSDWMTERFRALAGVWRNAVGVPDDRLAQMIREDGVDILVDLAMHTAGNRLPVFARQPAPVQVAWLAYAGSTGLPGIGYRLTDAHIDPPGSRGCGTAWSADEPVRLPDCWCCYDPLGDSPDVNALPAWSAKGVTFGSLNNFAKLNEGLLDLWARVLCAVKGSRLLMLCPEGSARDRVRAFFARRAIETERVELVGRLPRLTYLKLYQRIDVGLDPFPCNGMTTTCDALWMGVPVLTLPGSMPVSRTGLSLVSTVGLGELAASSEEDYTRIAAELAGDLPRLAELRATLRARMLASPLMDAPRFARNVEAAYRSMWRRWRLGQSSAPS